MVARAGVSPSARPGQCNSGVGSQMKLPPYQDSATLCANLCISANTLEALVKRGELPQPRWLGGKRVWKWVEVEAQIDGGPAKVEELTLAGRVTHATREMVNA